MLKALSVRHLLGLVLLFLRPFLFQLLFVRKLYHLRCRLLDKTAYRQQQPLVCVRFCMQTACYHHQS